MKTEITISREAAIEFILLAQKRSKYEEMSSEELENELTKLGYGGDNIDMPLANRIIKVKK